MAKLTGRAKAAFLARMERGRARAAGRSVRGASKTKRGSRKTALSSKRTRRGGAAQLTAALAAIADGKRVEGIATAAPASSSGPQVLLPSEANPIAARAKPFALRAGFGGAFLKRMF